MPRATEQRLLLPDTEALQAPAGSDRTGLEDPLDAARADAGKRTERVDDLHLPDGRLSRSRVHELGEIGLASGETLFPVRADASRLSGTQQGTPTRVIVEWRHGHANGPWGSGASDASRIGGGVARD